MTENAKILDIIPRPKRNKILLDSGHQIKVKENFREDTLEIIEPDGELSIKIKLTKDGPVVCLHGAKLEINSTESIKLVSKTIEISASRQATLKSDGQLEIKSTDKLDMKSDNDIIVAGKMVYIN